MSVNQNLADVIKEIYAEVDEDNVKTISTEIDQNIQAIMIDLGNKLTPEISQEVASVYNLNARFAFYNACFGKAHEVLNKVDPKLASVFATIQETNVFVVSRFTDKLLAMHPTIADLIQRLEEVEQEKGEGLGNHGDGEELEDTRKELDRLREDYRNAQERLNRQTREIERLRKDKPLATHTPQQRSQDRSEAQYEFEENYEDRRRSSKSTAKRSAIQDESMHSPAADEPFLLNWNNMNHNIGHANKRVVTLRQAKDLIEEISASKQKHDIKCLDSPIPRETMEQHMYNYLSQKFGLRSLVVEWATALVNCLKIYWNKDNDCAVFAMILRNECEDDFRNIQKQVKSTIQDLFKIALKNKMTTKKNSEIAKILDEKFKGWVTEEECLEILRYIYKDDDFNEIKEKVSSSLEVNDGKTTSGFKDNRRNMAIRYKEFERIILDFQLKNHHSFLSRFISLFRSYDPSNYGFVNVEQFRDMMGTIDPERELEVDRILKIIDPQDMGVIPFTTCVSIFASEPMNQDGEGATTILNYISAGNV